MPAERDFATRRLGLKTCLAKALANLVAPKEQRSCRLGKQLYQLAGKFGPDAWAELGTKFETGTGRGIVTPTYRQPFDVMASAASLTRAGAELDLSDPALRFVE